MKRLLASAFCLTLAFASAQAGDFSGPPIPLPAVSTPGSGDALIYGDGQFTSGSTAFSSATAAFTSADVGKIINWRRGLTSTSDFTTTFAAYVSPTAMTLTAAPSASSTFHCSAATVVTSQSGAGSYVPGNTETVSGGTQSSTCQFTVAKTQVASATVVAGGTGGTNGACTVTGTTGTGTKFQLSGTVTGNALAGALTVVVPGPYWTNPTDITNEPVTGCNLTGATVSVKMGIDTLSLPTQAGSYTALPVAGVFDSVLQTTSTSPTAVTDSVAGTGATLNVLWEGETFVYGLDRTADLLNAVAALPATGGGLQLSGGYLVSATTLLPSNVKVSTPGKATLYAMGPSLWSGGVIGWGLSNKDASVEYVTIDGISTSYPHSFGGTAHAIHFAGGSHIKVLNVTGDGGGDITAMVGTNDTLVANSIGTNINNACFDQWGGATEAKVIANSCWTWPQGGAGIGSIQFTGIATGGGVATSVGFTEIGNTIHVANGNGAQCSVINGPASNAGDDRRIVITGNHCIVDNGVSSWGFLVTGRTHFGNISNNDCTGNTAPFACVSVSSGGTGWIVSHNTAYDWQTGAGGVFANLGAGGTLDFNQAFNSTTPLLGTIPSTVQHAGNDNGTGLGLHARVNTFAATALFTPTPEMSKEDVFCYGAGGGGGGGGRQAASTAVSGGSGGGGGGFAYGQFLAAQIGASQTVTIGAVGAAGLAATGNTLPGGNGGLGGDSTFGSLLTAYGGGGGAGGLLGSASGGGGGGGALAAGGSATSGTAGTAPGGGGSSAGGSGAASASANDVGGSGGGGGLSTGAPASGLAVRGASGGGAGGGISAANAVSNGGSSAGAAVANTAITGGAGTGNPGTSPSTSTRPVNLFAGTGGAGGASALVSAFAGGAGGTPGGGGGGGGSAQNGGTAGAGGAGGAGYCFVVEYP